jgi:hypothetical protein
MTLSRMRAGAGVGICGIEMMNRAEFSFPLGVGVNNSADGGVYAVQRAYLACHFGPGHIVSLTST